MTHILHIDASPRGERSHSRRITREFVEQWKQQHPNDTVTYRDIGHNPVPHVDEPWIAAAFAPPEQRTPELWSAIRISDRLVDEFLAADIYVIGVPMYNFSVPSTFKAYIDQIVRVGRTVAFEPSNGDGANVFKPLVLGKKMFVIEARGDSGFKTERQSDLAVEVGLQELVTAASAESPKNYKNHRKYSHVMRKTNEGWRFAVLMSNNS